MAVLTIPPKREQDVKRAKDFLFAVYGESEWTDESYLEVANRSNQPVEFSEGRLVVLPMPTFDHQNIVGRIYVVLFQWAQKFSGIALVSPYPVRLGEGKFREPDVMLYSAEHRGRVAKQYGGPPDLVVEVLSPKTKKIDVGEKLIEYAQAGIGEYWMVDSESARVEQYVLEGDGYKLHSALGKGETLRAATLADLEVAVDEVYAEE